VANCPGAECVVVRAPADAAATNGEDMPLPTQGDDVADDDET
jgi:hypothetical protein